MVNLKILLDFLYHSRFKCYALFNSSDINQLINLTSGLVDTPISTKPLVRLKTYNDTQQFTLGSCNKTYTHIISVFIFYIFN